MTDDKENLLIEMQDILDKLNPYLSTKEIVHKSNISEYFMRTYLGSQGRKANLPTGIDPNDYIKEFECLFKLSRQVLTCMGKNTRVPVVSPIKGKKRPGNRQMSGLENQEYLANLHKNNPICKAWRL